MSSKSQLKRQATLDPIGMAEYISRLEKKVDMYAEALSDDREYLEEIKQLEADKSMLVELVLSLKPVIEINNCDWGIYQINKVLEKVDK